MQQAGPIRPNTDGTVSVFPNPTSEQIIVSSHNPVLNLQVADINNRVVYMDHPHTTKTTVSMSGLPPGVYVVNVHTENGTTMHRILLIR